MSKGALTDLKEFVTFASEQAEKIFRKTGEVLPLYHAIDAEGEHLILSAPPGDPDISVAMTKAWLALNNIDRVCFMNEGWILYRVDGPEITPGEMDRIRREGLRNHPDRREVVLFNAENKAGEMQSAHRFIMRPEHGKASLSPLVINDMSRLGPGEGRMIGLLNWEKRK